MFVTEQDQVRALSQVVLLGEPLRGRRHSHAQGPSSILSTAI